MLHNTYESITKSRHMKYSLGKTHDTKLEKVEEIRGIENFVD